MNTEKFSVTIPITHIESLLDKAKETMENSRFPNERYIEASAILMMCNHLLEFRQEPIEEVEKQNIYKVVLDLMKENPVKFLQFALTLIGREIQKSNATDFQFSEEATLEDGKRYKIKMVGTIEEIKK